MWKWTLDYSILVKSKLLERERESKNNSLSKTILRIKKPNNYINLRLHNSKVLSLNFGYQTGN